MLDLDAHVAAALGTPSVVVSLGADVARWAPADARRHRVLWKPMACRPCSHAVCPVGHGCATQLQTDEVADAVRDSLAAWPAPTNMSMPGEVRMPIAQGLHRCAFAVPPQSLP